MTDPSSNGLLSPRGAWELLDVSRSTFLRLEKEGLVRRVTVPGHPRLVRYRRHEIEQLAEKRL